MIKMPGPEKVEYQENQRDNTVINAIPEKGVCCSSEKFEMTTEQDEGGDVPTHDKHSDGNTYESEAEYSNISQVFRSKKKWICPIVFHESPVDGSKEHEPEYKQNLVPSEMKEQ